MSSREDILQSIRRATHVKYEKPDLKPLEDMALTYPSKVEQFYFVMKQVGGEAIFLEKEENVNDFIKKAYPGAKRIASNLKSITCATFNPDDLEESCRIEWDGFGCHRWKMGARWWVWIEQDVKQRAIYFIAEKLVILLDKNKIVNNMHEAYKLIDTGEYGFGTFISGPSKTADIEQALVMGAHGARDVMVVLI